MTLESVQASIPRYLIIITVSIFPYLTAVQAQERSACVVVRVPETYVLPDGSEHAAGTLTLCLMDALSPVTGLHRVAVDGHPLGMTLSRRSLAEGRDTDDPIVLFRRRGAGSLELVGYALPIGDKVWSYALEPTSEVARTRRSLTDPAAPEPELVAVMARRF